MRARRAIYVRHAIRVQGHRVLTCSRACAGVLPTGALTAIPPLVFLDTVRHIKHWAINRHKLAELVIYILFLGLLFNAAQHSFDPGDRFALRTRVLDLVLDEFLLEGQYVHYMHTRAAAATAAHTCTPHPHPRWQEGTSPDPALQECLPTRTQRVHTPRARTPRAQVPRYIRDGR